MSNLPAVITAITALVVALTSLIGLFIHAKNASKP